MQLDQLFSCISWVTIELNLKDYYTLQVLPCLDGSKARRAILDYGELLENAFGPPLKLALEEPQGEAWLRLRELLSHVVAVEVSCLGGGSLQEAPEPEKWAEAESPPLLPLREEIA